MKDIVTSVRRTPYQSMAAFLVLFFTLFISTALFISLSFLHGLLGFVETRPQVTVYFQTKTPESQIFKTRDDLVDSGKVLSVKYISKDEAFKIYKELNKDNPLLLEMVSSDILPPSLEIFAKKPIFLPEIADFLSKQPNVDEVNFQKDIVERLLTLTDVLRKITITFFTFLILMSVVVLTTTTLFKIALKKDEIELLQLLGASDFYIKKPFLLEGIFFGLIASLASFVSLVGIIAYFNPFLNNYLRGTPNLTLNLTFAELSVWPVNPVFLLVTFTFSLLFGIIIAIIAILLATKKYLKS
jgi:cell division transport system permease protein